MPSVETTRQYEKPNALRATRKMSLGAGSASRPSRIGRYCRSRFGLERRSIGPLDAVALALWLACFLLEAAADNQKFTFRSDPANKERFITTGVWALSRHPNYCGEIGMWTAQALAATSAFLSTGDAQLLGAWGSPLFTAFLLLRVSGAPMVDRAGEKKWGSDPAYRHYVANTNFLLPGRPARPAKVE